MSNSASTFGQRALGAPSTAAWVELEQSAGRDTAFQGIDALVDALLQRSLRGERVLSMTPEVPRGFTVRLEGLQDEQREWIEATFRLDQQRSRGALFLPEKARLCGGWANLPALFRSCGRFPTGAAQEEAGQVRLASSADSVLVWALLEPLFEALYRPFLLRGPLSGQKTREEQLCLWQEVETFLEALGFTVAPELAVMRYGGGWHRLHAEAQHEAKQRLLAALARQVHSGMGSRYRTYQLRLLLDQYYRKAVCGQITRKKALNRPLERVLTAFFGGDWLAFLSYIEEAPHPDEQVVTALPETRLLVHGTSRVGEVAAATGLPAEEVARIVGAFWQETGGASPVEQRVDVLARYWQAFDAIHARQRSGMKPLWGLVEEDTFLNLLPETTVPYQAGLYRELLPDSLVQEIDALWGAMMLPRWPESIVTAIYPHALMAQAFGPALSFWHGCALTAWFICEGPMSRTDMAGLAHYHRKVLAELERLGTPIASELFAELRRAEARLGPAKPIYETLGDSGPVTVAISRGSRRGGFDLLRDIITRYRQRWMEQHLTRYLRIRWESELQEAARQHHLLLHEKGKVLLRSFARIAERPTNHWFGGDITGLYRAIGEKSPLKPYRRALIPYDRRGLVGHVAALLEGKLANSQHLAPQSLRYLQLEEALGRAPSLEEFGVKHLGWLDQELPRTAADVWQIFTQAVEAVKASPVRSLKRAEQAVPSSWS